MRVATSLALGLTAILISVQTPAYAQSTHDNPSGAVNHRSSFATERFGPFRTAKPKRTRGGAARAASASRGCLTADTRRVLAGMESRFGAVKVISTCRPGAVIAGTGRPSQHRYGKAVDFVPRPGQRGAVLAWLRQNAGGAVITYGSGHIHFDTGPHRAFSCRGCGSRKARGAYARAR